MYGNGEIEARLRVVNPVSPPPPPHFGQRLCRGVSPRGARVIRRSVQSFVDGEASLRCVFITLTCSWPAVDTWEDRLAQDREFKRRVRNLLMAWRRKHPASARHYVVVFDLQARGVLHAHVLTFDIIPRHIFRELRDMWCDHEYVLRNPDMSARMSGSGRVVEQGYGMGAGGFDIRRVRHPRRAVAYLLRYITQRRRDGVRVSTSREDRVGRNGQPYVREVWAGNGYAVSEALRGFGAPVFAAEFAWLSPEARALLAHVPVVRDYGGVRFCGSVPAAEEFVAEVLELATRAPPVVDAELVGEVRWGLAMERAYEAVLADRRRNFAWACRNAELSDILAHGNEKTASA